MFVEMVDIDIQLFLCDPISKLLVSINRSSHLIYFITVFSGRANETNIHEIKSRGDRVRRY